MPKILLQIAGHRWLIQANANVHAFAATWLGETFDAMDALIYFIALFPALSELLKTTDPVQIGWIGSVVMACFMIGWSIGSIAFGVVADKFGRKAAMMYSIMLYALATGLCALAHNWQELAICRFLVGLGIGGEISIGVVFLAESWQGPGRRWATALMQTSFASGALLVGMANLLVGATSWRYLFLIGMVPAILTFYIRSKLKEPSINAGTVSNTIGTAALSGTELTTNMQTRTSTWFCTAFNQLNRVLQDFGAEDRKQLRISVVLAMAAIVGYWAAVSWIPAWINQLTGGSAVDERSLATSCMSIGGIIACFATPPLINGLGKAGAFRLSYLMAFTSVLGTFIFIKTYSTLLLGLCTLIGFSATLPFVILCIHLPEVFRREISGTASGITWSAGRLVAAAAAVFGSQFIGLFGGSFAAAGAIVSIIYLAGAFISQYVEDSPNLESETLVVKDIAGTVN